VRYKVVGSTNRQCHILEMVVYANTSRCRVVRASKSLQALSTVCDIEN
jgi:hypothetical protein